MTTTFIKWHYNGILKLYQKEKEKNKKYQGIENGTTIIYKAKAKYVREDFIKRYYVDKNKIREKIKELEQELEEERENGLDFTLMHEHEIDINGIIEVLHELLGE